MRNSFLSFSLSISLAAALLASCGSPDATPPDATPPDANPPDANPPDANPLAREDLLAESLLVWQDLKAADDGTYQYTRSDSSFSGYRSTTTFVVVDDVVVRRTFEGYDENGVLVDSFDEQGAEVGTNEGAEPARTIDELYEICRTEVLTQDPDSNYFYLTFRDDGVLELCVYVPRDCADDCSEGVEISSLDMSL